MQKQGLPLPTAIKDLGDAVLARLREEFSITTVEEFISASAHSGDHLRVHLCLTSEQWNKACQTGRSLLSSETAGRLQRPVHSRFAKGAALIPGLQPGSDLSRYLGRE